MNQDDDNQRGLQRLTMSWEQVLVPLIMLAIQHYWGDQLSPDVLDELRRVARTIVHYAVAYVAQRRTP